MVSHHSLKRGVSYFGVRNPKHVFQDMQDLKKSGFTHVLHTYSEEDLQYYRETMKEIIDISVDLGLSVYVNPWGVGRVFGGEAYSELVAKNPGTAQISADGTIQPAICPTSQVFIDYLMNWLDAIAETKAETIFWDEPHFYFAKGNLNNWACRCPNCQKLFKKAYGFQMPDNLTPEVLEFRETALVNFLHKMTLAAKERQKRNTVCMLPPWFPAGIDDWNKIASLPSVDEIASDPYQERNDSSALVLKHYKKTAERLMKTAKEFNKEAQMWVKCYLIEEGREQDVTDSVLVSYDAGIRNIFAWSYKASEYLSWLRSDNPEKAWLAYLESFKKLSV